MPIDCALRVLVVDDSRTTTGIICSLLEQVGVANVERAGDGETALEKLRGGSFSLVISDWKMAPMGGLELLRRIRQEPALQSVRFIMMSADPNPQLPQTMRSVGAVGFLLKPFTADQLRDLIEQLR
jgi:two-component system, chemotaxis family, chemotaxis protein CheY